MRHVPNTLLAGLVLLLSSCGPATPGGNDNANVNGNANDNGNGTGATVFSATLTGAAERPNPVETTATGDARFEFTDDGLVYELTVNDGTDIFQAHIHLGGTEDAGPVVAFLFGPVDGGMDVDGQLAQGTLNDDDLVGNLAGATLDDLLEEFRDGNAYVNVHSLTFQAGEIRGQLTPGSGG